MKARLRREQRQEKLCQTSIELRVNLGTGNAYHDDVSNSSTTARTSQLLPEENALLADTLSRSLAVATQLLSPKAVERYEAFLHLISPVRIVASTEPLGTREDWSPVEFAWSSLWSLREHQLATLAINRGTSNRRKQHGVYYTPRAFVEQIVDVTFAKVTHRSNPPLRVLDPTCGTGNFLVSTYEYQRQHGVPPDEILEGLFGIDTDPVALTIAQARLGLLHLSAKGSRLTELRDHLVVGNALELLSGFPKNNERLPRTFDVVVGNPPFLNRVRGEVLLDSTLRSAIDIALDGTVRPYTDVSAILLALAVNATREGGAVGMCQPSSVVAGRDSAALRERLVSTATLDELLIAGGRSFDAGTSVVAPILRIQKRDQGRRGGSWSSHVARHFKIPTCVNEDLAWKGLLGEIADVTADFRDQYYWICARLDQPLAHNAQTARVLTSGHIGSGYSRWDDKTVRIGGQHRLRPTVTFSLASDDPSIIRWLDMRLQPKLVVATQTKTLECAIDLQGDFLPLTPVLSVVPRSASMLFHLQAVLLNPTITSLVCTATLGTGLTLRALKLSASELRALPLPAHQIHWDNAAAIHERLHKQPDLDIQERKGLLIEAAHLMALAYQDPNQEIDWWTNALDFAEN
jgi:SAM-dependent methyltransferase